MSLTCPNCGAENRDSAKFCLKCAHQLVPLAKAEPAPPVARPKRRRRRSAADTSANANANANAALDEASAPGASLRLHGFLIAVAALLLAALIGVMLAQRNAAAPARTQSAGVTPAAAAASGPSALPAIAPASSAAVAPATAAGNLAPPPRNLASAPTLTALPPTLPASTGQAQALSERAPRPARSAKPAAKPAAASAPTPAPAASEPPPPPPRPAPAPVPAAPSALCSDARFLAHAICLQNECNKPGTRQHPQCVRMREQQEALRRGSGDS